MERDSNKFGEQRGTMATGVNIRTDVVAGGGVGGAAVAWRMDRGQDSARTHLCCYLWLVIHEMCGRQHF